MIEVSCSGLSGLTCQGLDTCSRERRRMQSHPGSPHRLWPWLGPSRAPHGWRKDPFESLFTKKISVIMVLSPKIGFMCHHPDSCSRIVGVRRGNFKVCVHVRATTERPLFNTDGIFKCNPDYSVLLKVLSSGGSASGSPLRVFLASLTPAVM